MRIGLDATAPTSAFRAHVMASQHSLDGADTGKLALLQPQQLLNLGGANATEPRDTPASRTAVARATWLSRLRLMNATMMRLSLTTTPGTAMRPNIDINVTSRPITVCPQTAPHQAERGLSRHRMPSV